ncbi:MAG: PAS domain-containing protein [Gammaproteobacteria bacterium]|nr:PAS domain-containing protein [Gammaproteobacteria bacterium]
MTDSTDFLRNELLQLVLDNIPQFIFWKDVDSVYLGCNANLATVAGVQTPEDIVGKTDYDLAWNAAEADAFRADDLREMKSNAAQYHIIEPQHQAGGKQAWLDTNKIPLRNSDGEVIGLLGTFEDITERIALETELAKHRSNLEALVEERTTRLTRTNKELRTAINDVKTLRGIIPICASCKSIRDDQGAWKAIEAYVMEHSEAEFSHGICQQCAKTLYPGYVDGEGNFPADKK